MISLGYHADALIITAGKSGGTSVDIVLVNSGGSDKIYQSLAEELVAKEPPVWVGLLAAYATQCGHEVCIIDADADGLTSKQVAAAVADISPALVAIVVYGHQPSASTQLMPASGCTASAIKESNPTQPIIMIGGHVAALPERTLREENVDCVSTGEGLVTLDKLTTHIKANTDWLTSPDLARVPGLMWLDHGHLLSTAEPPLVGDLDAMMPALPWELLPMSKYRAHNWQCFGGLSRQPYAAVYTSLGCPYKCTFCCIQAPFKNGELAAGMSASRNSYRLWSPKLVVDQLEHLAIVYGIRTVKFADEMFVLNRRHVEGICDEIIARGLDLNIWAYARVDTVKDGMVDKLRAAGFRWLAFGIESANESVRDGVDKGFGQDEMFATIAKVRAADINVIANYIFGLPNDDQQTMRQTLDLAKQLNAEFANFYSAMAYPGSPLFAQAQSEGWQLPVSWSGYSQHSVNSTPLPTAYLSSAEIIAFRDRAFSEYFSSDAYLDMIRAKFGEATVNEVKLMCQLKLERNAALS